MCCTKIKNAENSKIQLFSTYPYVLTITGASVESIFLTLHKRLCYDVRSAVQ